MSRGLLRLSFVVIFLLIIIASCLMYFAEHNEQPDKFSSIQATAWWAIVSITTPGYGHQVSITALGRVIASFILLVALAVIALPAGIITAGFLEDIRKMKNHDSHVCPHWGKPLDQ